MSQDDGHGPRHAVREYAQLLRLQERMLTDLQRIRDEVDSGPIRHLIKVIRNRTGKAPEEELSDVVRHVEEAIRTVKMFEAGIRKDAQADPESLEVEGAPNLPATLARFLAERDELPGFHYEVEQDQVRGWVVSWKEYTEEGTVRGSGQFYERPYAWFDQ